MPAGTETGAGVWIGAVVLTIALSAALTEWFRRYALARQILDHPNERSSHHTPTARGGGVAVVAVVLAGLAVTAFAGLFAVEKAAAIGGGGLIVALVGWWDDRRGLSAGWRFLAHLIASALAVAVLGLPPRLSVFSVQVDLGWFAYPAATISVTALINITNFMDGIDGLAAAEAICVFALGGFLVGGSFIVPMGIAAGACCGFLTWNWPPAKIFMGDVGSGFLGFLIGAFILLGVADEPRLFWSLSILPSAFLVDGAITLLRRMATGQKWTQPHRSHAYQHAARRWGHLKVTLAFIALNVLWILPLSLLASRLPGYGAVLLLFCWTPLGALALWQRAGVAEPRPNKDLRS